MNVLIRMAFDGTRYHGFQVQKNAVTVCGALQDAMQAVFGARGEVKGCSRTDAGVHARDFCASFHVETQIPAEKISLALNSRLPRDIRVWHARAVPAQFHARYAALGKQYRYVILNSAVEDAFAPHLSCRVTGPLNEEAMRAAGQRLVGRHNFSAFMSQGGCAEDTVRTVREVSVRRAGEFVHIDVSADGFLYNMVRIIAGTLVQAGRGRTDADGVAAALASGRRGEAGETMPARGLFLNRVYYP